MKYRILHIPSGTFIRSKKETPYRTKYPTLVFWFNWRANRWLKKLPDEFYFLNKDDQFEKVLKAELIVIPVASDKTVGMNNND
jgi:hypothetical protein